MKFVTILISLFFFSQTLLGMPLHVYALTPKEEKGVKVLKSPRLAYESPDRFTPFSLDKAPKVINYRKSILPFEQDRNEDMYIVLPTLGIISPVVFVPEGTNDYNKMTQGKEIDINAYLNRGVMHYPGTGLPGNNGNPVIFGHSNFFLNGEGDYKTIFADIMNLDVGFEDEIWIFSRSINGKDYDLLKFSIEQSYETVPTDVQILYPRGGKEITVFACTNGLEGRWILRGKFIEIDETLVPYPIKFRVLTALDKIKKLPLKRQLEIRDSFKAELEKVSAKDSSKGESYDAKFKRYLLDYLDSSVENLGAKQ